MAAGSETDFRRRFGRDPEIIGCAPGRVNLIGEHTDYNAGYVFPIVMKQQTCVQLARREDTIVRAWSANAGPTPDVLIYHLGAESVTGTWLDYLQGVTWALRAADHPITGFDVQVESGVPMGSGLASSAALEVAVLRALRHAFALPIHDVALAEIAHKAETEFVGVPVGIMDQMAASLADRRTALFLDTRSLEYERVPLPRGVEIVIVDSGVKHEHASGEYRVRRAECEQACIELGVTALREVTIVDEPRVERLPEPHRRRVRHVMTENARVMSAVAALRTGNLIRLGALLYASHESLRDDYEVSIPELDYLVAAAHSERDVVGARMTGGGFGGCALIVTTAGAAERVGEAVADRYAARYPHTPRVILP